MKAFEFSVIASGLDPESADFADRFFLAGCDDATISFQKGRIIVDFTREAPSIGEAIASALESVRAAGATVDRIEPDPLVSLSDIAARSGLTRAAITQYAKGQRGKNFPAPIARVTSDSPLWDWAVVAKWLYGNSKLSRDDAIAAEAVRLANITAASPDPGFRDTLEGGLQAYAQALEAA
ncbi:MAG: hypothetical protein HZA66_06025 [Rhodopseudomonas palustris]|uniref:DNA-binding protein n=1 Tax=Rhodopseudomonas palustris TaxID=1076 RepID=A0A933RVI9_RHOPL|nr:hypothetical protein [Rhodopseudomonas palustris]